MAKDPYKYFRVEAREILDSLSQGIREPEAGAAAPQEAVAGLLRRAHTLKGAARVVKQPRIAEAAHAMEDVLARYRETGGPVDAQSTSGLLGYVDSLSAMLSSLDSSLVDASASAPPLPSASALAVTPVARVPVAPSPVDRPVESAVEPGARLAIAETVRIEIQEMDTLLHGIAELGVRVSGIRAAMAAVAQAQLFASALAEELRSAGMSGAPSAAIDRGRALA